MEKKYWEIEWVEVETKDKGEIKKENKVNAIKGLKVEDDTSLENFKFKIIRQKSRETRQEIILINAFYCDEDYGFWVTSIGKIYSDITKLNDIGIRMKRQQFNELAKVIDDNFYNLMLEHKEYIGNNVPEEMLYKIIEHFRQYIQKNKIEIKNECYNIPAKDFKEEYDKSPFKNKAAIKEVKEALKLYGYTKCNANRKDCNVKLEDGKKGVRCISFIAERIDEEE